MITWTGSELLRQARLANGSLGEGMTMHATEVNDDLVALNLLLASWDIQLYAHTQETKAMVVGDADYTWGTGGNINTARPIDLLDLTFIRIGTIDYPVSKITEVEYKQIPDKSSSGRPEKIWFDPQFPLAVIYLSPVPDSTDTLYLTSLKGISEITDVTATVSIPQETAAAIKWNLAIELAPNYGVQVTPIMAQRAMQTKSVVLARAFMYRVNTVSFDNMLDQSGGDGTILDF